MRSVSRAIWPSIEPVLVAEPPYSAKMEDFFSFVKYDILIFFKCVQIILKIGGKGSKIYRSQRFGGLFFLFVHLPQFDISMNCIHVVGNRPQFIKLALLHQAIAMYTPFTQKILHTG